MLQPRAELDDVFADAGAGRCRGGDQRHPVLEAGPVGKGRQFSQRSQSTSCKWDMCVARLTHMAPPTQHAGMTATPDSSMNAMPCGTPFLEKLTRPLSRSNSISMMSPVVYASPYAVKARVPLFCEA